MNERDQAYEDWRENKTQALSIGWTLQQALRALPPPLFDAVAAKLDLIDRHDDLMAGSALWGSLLSEDARAALQTDARDDTDNDGTTPEKTEK